MKASRSLPDLKVRSAAISDLDRITVFNVKLAAESEGMRLDSILAGKGVEAALLDSARGLYFLAETPERVVGQILVTAEWSDWRNAYFWWLQSVYVLPEFRGRGVLRALYEHVRRIARGRGDVHGLRLYVHVENEAAEKAYERLGMRRLDYRMMEADLGEVAPDSDVD